MFVSYGSSNQAVDAGHNCLTLGSSTKAGPCFTTFAGPFNSAQQAQCYGLIPTGGITISNLTAVAAAAPGAGKSYTVDVIQMDNTNTTSVILSCSISGTSTTCGASSGTGAASAGTFLQVRITNVGGAANSQFFVSFQ